MFQNKLKRTLSEGKTAIGLCVTTGCADLVEVAALSGYDFVVIDAEHGPVPPYY